MTEKFWFNRMVEHWTPPQRLDLVEHVRRGRLQVVQTGNFGPQLYSLADDPTVDRSWVGMPLIGLRENLDYIGDLIPRVQEAGARFIGQLSMAWHYGDHLEDKGLFGVWKQIWTDDLLGPAPCSDPTAPQQFLADGSPRRWAIEGRPYYAYSGCMCNPHWLATLKPMVRKAIELGVDGFNVHHNFENFCACDYCRDYVISHLQKEFSSEDLKQILGTSDPASIGDPLIPIPECPPELKQRFGLFNRRLANIRRKEAFDDIFITYGRSLKPDLMLAQWYHKYDFKPHDERSLLPDEMWAKDEDYIWYSQGGNKGVSSIRHGYLADMGLPARYTYAAGEGRPFIINKYDYRRWRLSIAEAAANHFAGPAFHWADEGNPDFSLEDYCAPVFRYHRFLADHQNLIHPARPWSQLALVYPRRAEFAGETDSLEPLKRLGRLLEDDHILFDIILDEQLEERLDDYDTLILPDIVRLSPEEAKALRSFVQRGGKLILTGKTGTCRKDGEQHSEDPFAAWRPTSPEDTPIRSTVTTQISASAGEEENACSCRSAADGRVLCLSTVPLDMETAEIRPGTELLVYPPLERDPFGQGFLQELHSLLERSWLTTDAPWYVRVRAWHPESETALVLHWVNYCQDEDSAIEVPHPTGPLQVECRIPDSCEVEGVEWLYPEMANPVSLDFTKQGNAVSFAIPSLVVYGLSVLRLREN
jgi:hypothetical protein